MTTAAGPKSKVPKIPSFNNVMQHIQDALTPAKLHFFVCIAKMLTPFLQKFQTDKPMVPFLRELDQIDAKKMELRFAVKAEIDKVQKETAVSSLQIYSFQMECRTLPESSQLNCLRDVL